MWNFTQNLPKRANEKLTKYSPLTKISITKAVLLAALSLAFFTQANASTFTAKASGNWDEPQNWNKTNINATNTVPGPGDEVIIPAGYNVLLDRNETIGTLNVGGVLSFSSQQKKLTVSGDVELSGTLGLDNLVLQPNTTFTFKGGGTMPDLRYYNVVIDLPALSTDLTANNIKKSANPNSSGINTSLTVKSGNLKINNTFDITGLPVTINGANALITFGGQNPIVRVNEYITTLNGGMLVLENVGKGSSIKRQGDVLFPVGTANSYNPITINNKDFNNATHLGNFGVTVSNGVFLNGLDGPAVTDHVVNKTWQIFLKSGTSNASIRCYWNQADETPNFNRQACAISHYDLAGGWETAGVPYVPATSTGPTSYYIERERVTAFSPFGVTDGLSPLPVELVSFNAVKKASEVALTWETASEKDNMGFEVQASADGKNYEALGFVASQNGNANFLQRYAYADKTAGKEGLVYYRLKQINLDGTVAYYSAKVVDLGKPVLTASVSPNPFQDQFRLNLPASANEPAEILLTDMAGRTVYQSHHQLVKGENNLEVSINNYPAGLYLLKAVTNSQTYTSQIIKQ